MTISLQALLPTPQCYRGSGHYGCALLPSAIAGTPASRARPTDLIEVLFGAVGQAQNGHAEEAMVARHLLTRLKKAVSAIAGTKPTQPDFDDPSAGCGHEKGIEARFKRLEKNQKAMEENMKAMEEAQRRQEQQISSLPEGIDDIKNAITAIKESITS